MMPPGICMGICGLWATFKSTVSFYLLDNSGQWAGFGGNIGCPHFLDEDTEVSLQQKKWQVYRLETQSPFLFT